MAKNGYNIRGTLGTSIGRPGMLWMATTTAAIERSSHGSIYYNTNKSGHYYTILTTPM